MGALKAALVTCPVCGTQRAPWDKECNTCLVAEQDDEPVTPKRVRNDMQTMLDAWKRDATDRFRGGDDGR